MVGYILKTKLSIALLLVVFVFSTTAFGAEKLGSVGQPAADIYLSKWITPNPPQVKNLKGRVYLIEFWATWCGPCVSSIGTLNKLYDKYAPQGLEIIALSQDRDEAMLAKFVNDKNIRYSVAIDRGTVNYFGVTGYPTTVLVDHTGKIIWRGHPWDWGMEKNIKKALSNAPAAHLAGVDLGAFGNLKNELANAKTLGRAYQKIEAAMGNATDESATDAKIVLGGINANIQRQINIAERLRKSSPKMARNLYSDIVKNFGEITAAKRALTAYADLKNADNSPPQN
jgi:thiol-disulfide isomerase/thioredoxin